MSDHGDRGGRNSEMKLVCCKSWGFGTHPNGGVCFRGVNPPYRSLKWHKVSFAHLWVAQATLRNQERNSHATHGSWFDRVNRDEAVVLLQTAHRKVPFSWLIQHHSLGSLLLLSRVATPKILLCCDIFSRGSAIHGRQIVATRSFQLSPTQLTCYEYLPVFQVWAAEEPDFCAELICASLPQVLYVVSATHIRYSVSILSMLCVPHSAGVRLEVYIYTHGWESARVSVPLMARPYPSRTAWMAACSWWCARCDRRVSILEITEIERWQSKPEQTNSLQPQLKIRWSCRVCWTKVDLSIPGLSSADQKHT